MSRLFRIFVVSLFIFAAANAKSQTDATPPSPQAQTVAPDKVFADAHRSLDHGQYDEAIAQLQKLEATTPRPEGLSHELGVAFYKKADYTSAIRYLREATEQNPKDNESTQLLGLSYYLSGKPQDAVPLLEKVQTWFPNANVDASYILGICYIHLKDYPHARGAFAKMFDVGQIGRAHV